MGLSVPEVCSGLQSGLEHARTQLDSLVTHSVDLEKLRDPKAVSYAIRSSVMSKQYGCEQFLADIVAKACVSTLPKGKHDQLYEPIF